MTAYAGPRRAHSGPQRSSACVAATLFAAAVATSATVAAAAATSAVVWHGFDVSWNRKILGFATPHRLGSFANYLTSSDATAAPALNVTFTPGVCVGR
jgi:hypothetical protein